MKKTYMEEKYIHKYPRSGESKRETITHLGMETRFGMYRTFNGKKYTYAWATPTKSEAVKLAKVHRSDGTSIRVVKTKKGYVLYERKAK
jgi:hypothetical protein